MNMTNKLQDLQKLKQKKCFLFDIDGTIAVGNTLYEGSRELLEYIESIGGKAYYITNNSTKSNQDYVDKFAREFQLTTTENQFVTSGFMTTNFLKEKYGDKKIYVLGTTSYIAELRKNELTITEEYADDIACVVVAYDSELNYQKLTTCCQILSTLDIPFYGTNPDLCCPIDFGFIPDCGSICDMITNSVGKKPVYLGKPSALVVDVCLADCGFSKEETVVVGDRLYTDIACGINAGVETIVLYTGEATHSDVETTEYKPTYDFETVADLNESLRSF